MTKPTAAEVAVAMQEDPKAWAEQYINLLYRLDELHELNVKLLLQVLPVSE